NSLDNSESIQEMAVIIQDIQEMPKGVTFSPESGLKLYLLICEAKRLNVPSNGDYNKLCRMLHDAANSFILYWVKKIRKIPLKLKKLFCEMQWIGLFSKGSEDNKIRVITYPNSHPVKLPISHDIKKNHDIAGAFEVFLQIENHEVIKDIQEIVDRAEIEEYDLSENKLEYLTKIISESPPSPQKRKL
ncbi:20091_t:CDS:2, partial [Dentiscutata erythropus]